jgi:hypothetical protein
MSNTFFILYKLRHHDKPVTGLAMMKLLFYYLVIVTVVGVYNPPVIRLNKPSTNE